MANERGYRPYHFQRVVRDAFLAGENIILQAPTGAGKTKAALEPAIAGLDRSQRDKNLLADYPQRVVYSVPMRVLARSFVADYAMLARNRRWEPHWYPTIQTGENPEDPLFEGRIIFATVDQMLASFLNIPYGLPNRLANINAGAMIGSYLVFDEFHLYPREQMMTTVLAMLKMLQGVSRFVLMSATFSPVFLREIGRYLGASVIADPPGTPLEAGLFADVVSVQTQQRRFYAEQGRLDAQELLAKMGRRTLCVCNTVDRAQALYRDLQGQTEADVRLLHSRFYRQDRQRTEQFVQAQFEAANRPVILVATQVVEVGLDISSDVLLTECAPAASLIQRAGRCARRMNEVGRVHVYQPFDDNGDVSYVPYLEEGQETVCQKSWDALCSDAFNGRVMDFPQEQKLIEIAHAEVDGQLIAQLATATETRIEKITECMKSRHAGLAAQLIRTQDTVPLYVDPAPNQDDSLTQRPWRREGFNLSKGQISRAFRNLQEESSLDADFLYCAGQELPQADDQERFKWQPLKEASEIYSPELWHFVAHPLAVSYTPKVGLELRPGPTPAILSPMAPGRSWERPRYEAERYHEHIAGLFFAYQMAHSKQSGQNRREHRGLRDELLYPLRRLCFQMDLDPAQAERMLRLTLALHDVGKLNSPWQAWSRAWQSWRAKHGYAPTIPLTDPAPLAHTDFDSDDEQERALQNSLKHAPRGNHAGEGAAACLPILWQAGADQLWLAVCDAAIMHHHTPNVDSAGAFHCAPGFENDFLKALRLAGFGEEAGSWLPLLQRDFERDSGYLGKMVDEVTPNRSGWRATLMYLLFVRTLRLADQRSGITWRAYGELHLPALLSDQEATRGAVHGHQ